MRRKYGIDGVDLEVLDCGDRDDIGEVGEFADGHQRFGDFILGYSVDLRHESHDRGASVQQRQLGGDVPVSGADRLIGGQAEADDVDFPEGGGH